MENAHTVSTASRIRSSLSTAASGVKIILATVVVAVGLKLFVVEAYRIPSASMERTLAVGDFILVNKLAYALQTPRTIPFSNIALPHVSWQVFGTIHRGDVIVFEFDERKAEEAKSHLVKRVLGTPGDRVELKGGTVFVNGNSERAPRRGIPMHEGLQLHDEVWEVPRRGQAVQLTSENLARWQPLIQREGHTALLSDGNKTLIDGKSASRYTIEENYYFVLGDHREASSDSRVWGFVPEQDIVGEALIVYWSWDTEAQPSGIVEKILSIRWSRIGNLIR